MTITTTTSIRDTDFYKSLTPYTAAGLAEGFVEPDEGDVADQEQQVIAAWQYLYDKRLYMTLQGWVGRGCAQLLEQGVIER